MVCSNKHAEPIKHAMVVPAFAKKGISLALSMVLGCSGAFLVNKAKADPVFYEANSSNASVSTVGLNYSYLGDGSSGALTNPSSLATGTNQYKYAAVLFRPDQSGSYTFGQTYAGPSGNIDTVMVFYDGAYDPNNPGNNAKVGNDDTGQQDHRDALNDQTVVTSCNSSGWCPQITYNVTAGQVYTLWVSVYKPSYNSMFDIPFQFYSTGTGQFGSLLGLGPIDTNAPFYLASDLDFLVLRVFKGGTLRMDTDNAVYSSGFTVHDVPNSTIDQFGNNSLFSGVISDAVAGQPGSLTIANSGTGGSVTFSAINTYTGNTTITEGAFLNMASGGVIGGTVNVASAGVLGGSGTVGNLAVQSGGLVAPAYMDASAPMTTLNVNGNATFDAGSLYRVRIDETLASDKLAVTGAASLNGGTVQASLAPWASQDPLLYTEGGTYTILTADGGVTGHFADLTRDFAFFNLLLDYDANNVFLKIRRIPFTDYATTENQWQAATGAESLGYGNALYDAMLKLPYDGNEVRRALDQISGEAHASIQSALIEDNHFIRDAANDRMRAAYTGGKGSAGNAEMIDASGNVFWGRVFGSWGKQNGNHNAADLDRNIGGFILGADTAVADWRVGALAGYSQSNYDIDNRSSNANSDNYYLGAYGTTAWDAWAFRTGLIHGWHNIDTKRSVGFTGYSDTLKSDYDASSWQAFGEVSYRHAIDTSYLEPFVNLSYVNLKTDSFTENGGAAAVHASGQTTETSFSTVGLRVSRDFTASAMDMSVRGLVGWRHAFGDTDPKSRLNLIGGTGYTVTGVPIAKDAAVLEAGIDLKLSRTATLGISYQGMAGNDAHENGGYVHFNWKF